MNLNKALEIVINCRCTDDSTTELQEPTPGQDGLNECKNDSKLAWKQKESFAFTPGNQCTRHRNSGQEAPLPGYIV